MSETTDEYPFSRTYVPERVYNAPTEHQMMMYVLEQINQNLIEIKKLLEEKK